MVHVAGAPWGWLLCTCVCLRVCVCVHPQPGQCSGNHTYPDKIHVMVRSLTLKHIFKEHRLQQG